MFVLGVVDGTKQAACVCIHTCVELNENKNMIYKKSIKMAKKIEIMLDTCKTEKTNGKETSHKVNPKYFYERRVF